MVRAWADWQKKKTSRVPPAFFHAIRLSLRITTHCLPA